MGRVWLIPHARRFRQRFTVEWSVRLRRFGAGRERPVTLGGLYRSQADHGGSGTVREIRPSLGTSTA